MGGYNDLKYFKNKIRRGLGSAILELKSNNDITRYRDIVLWACLNDTCYDSQVEGSRGYYLHEAVCCFDDKEYFENAIIKKYLKNNKCQDSDQLTAILYCFACDGSQKAIDSLYNKFNYYINYLPRKSVFHRNERESFECLMIYLCDLHGFREYKKMIVEIGKVIVERNSSDMFFLDWFYDSSNDKIGKGRVIDYLEKNSQTSPYVKAYYDAVTANIQSQKEFKNSLHIDNITIDDILNYPSDDDFYYIRVRNLARRLSRVLNDEKKSELADNIINETDLEKKALMLSVFEFIQFPAQVDILIDYSDTDNKLLREASYKALARCKNNKAYELSVSLLSQKKNIIEALDMLVLNYRKDDDLIYSIVKSCRKSDDFDFHSIGMIVREIYRLNKSKNSYKTLIYMYNHGLCSFCREDFVRIMHNNKILPDSVLNECLYDSNLDLRKYAKRIKSRR